MLRAAVKSLSAALVTTLALTLPAAATTVLSSDDNGTIVRNQSPFGFTRGTFITHDPNSQARTVSNVGVPGASTVTGGYFLFDLSGFSGTATQATIDLVLSSVSPTFTLSLFEVSADPAAFDLAYDEGTNSLFAPTPLGPGNDLFFDITGGSLAGQGSVTADGPLSISFTADGLAALNASVGGTFALGLAAGDNSSAMVTSESLRIEGLSAVAPVPVPLPALLLLSAVGGMIMVRRRSKRATA